jgi:hypothetical protein
MEVYKMNLNKTGKHVKKDDDSTLSAHLGVTMKFKTELPKLHSGVKLTKNSYFDDKSNRILLEAEFKKNQAFELFHRLQKC